LQSSSLLASSHVRITEHSTYARVGKRCAFIGRAISAGGGTAQSLLNSQNCAGRGRCRRVQSSPRSERKIKQPINDDF
jgi:hypothetical protein